MKNLFDVKDKIVLITGSSRGIGYSIARGFAEAGSVVIINGTSDESVQKTVGELKSKGYKIFGKPFDVTRQTDIKECIDDIEKNKKTLFLAEGLLNYFTKEDVKNSDGM